MENKNEKNHRKNMMYIIVFGVLLLIILISAAYAYFAVGTSITNSLVRLNGQLPCLNVTYTESDTINMTNSYPMSDASALSTLTPVTVTVTNNCSNTQGDEFDYVFTLATLSNSSGYIPDNKIRMYVTRNLDNAGVEVYKPASYLNSLMLLKEDSNTYKYFLNDLNTRNNTRNYTNKTLYRISNDSINAGETNVYTVYLWIDYYEGDTTHAGLNDHSTEGLNFAATLSIVINGEDRDYSSTVLLGSGTESNPYQINYIEDLVRIRNHYTNCESLSENGTDYGSGGYYKLMRDLDFNLPESYENSASYGDYNDDGDAGQVIEELTTGRGMPPIGDGDCYTFGGTFDGGNHRIDNYYHKSVMWNQDYYLGFFGTLATDSVIKDFTISGNIDADVYDYYTMGGLAAEIYDTPVTISNCHSEVNLIGDNNYTGGLVGEIVDYNYEDGEYILIDNSSYSGNITHYSGSTGGLVGHIQIANLIISNSHNDGNIIITDTSTASQSDITYRAKMGGLIGTTGEEDYWSPPIYIINSYNNGRIESNYACDFTEYNNYCTFNDADSGFIGKVWGGDIYIANSYNAGAITGQNANGILFQNDNGDNSSEVEMQNVFNFGTISTRNTGSAYGIARFNDDNTLSNINNAYYLNGQTASNKALSNAYSKTTSEFNSQAFVNTLNTNKQSITLPSYLDGYSLSSWELGPNGYPVLVNN